MPAAMGLCLLFKVSTFNILQRRTIQNYSLDFLWEENTFKRQAFFVRFLCLGEFNIEGIFQLALSIVQGVPKKSQQETIIIITLIIMIIKVNIRVFLCACFIGI